MSDPADKFDPVNKPATNPERDGPRDPISAMGADAVALHEIFLAYTAAGFSAGQATYLCGIIIAEAVRKSPS